jgi:hypothetical protein
MNLGVLKSELGDLMARTDYTGTKQVTHINRAIRRIQSAARLPEMEKAVTLTLDSTLGADIPADFRSTRHIFFTDGIIPCEKIDLNRVSDYDHVYPPLNPRPYYRLMDRWYFPVAREGDEITLIYYAPWDPLVNDEDFNELTINAPEAVIYGAASYACTYFKDVRVTEMEERFKAELDEIMLQKWQEEIATGSAQSMRPVQDQDAYPGGW